MKVYTVRPFAKQEPPQWIIVVADSAAPGKSRRVLEIMPFTDHKLAKAEAIRLNAGGVLEP